MPSFHAPFALLDGGWSANVRIDCDVAGMIFAVTPESKADGCERLAGPVVPGMPNLHSHAFQRAIAGSTERATGQADSFWTWREAMYRAAFSLTPDDMATIAKLTFVEMLKAGYTSVAEFHYIHRDRDGSPYDDPSALSIRVIEAARAAGIAITHLPVLYMHSGFGAKPPLQEQRRFIENVDGITEIRQRLQKRFAADRLVKIGLAPHSLRAATPDAIQEAVRALKTDDPQAPVHIHAAEQTAEVEGSLAVLGARPVEILLDRLGAGQGWCLVHATHLTEDETDRLAGSGAVAGLCPTTEANLGDGLFPLGRYQAKAGRFGIGSDSNVTIDPREELRLLDYGRRLMERRRAGASTPNQPSPGAALVHAALAGGAEALAQPIGAIAPGLRADLVVLDMDDPALAGRGPNDFLDAFVYVAHGRPVRDVLVAGRFVIRDRHHQAEEQTRRDFAKVVASLFGS